MKIYISIPISGKDLATQQATAAQIADKIRALGKEVGQKGRPLKTYITDEDKENVRAEYNAMIKAYESPRNSGEKEYAKEYIEALEWLFGIRFLTNQQKDNE